MVKEGFLELWRVRKKFGGLNAINGVDVKVEEGQIEGLVGPNGAGKTTLFNLITGYLKPDEGRISFEGKNIVGLRPHQICRLGITRTFQIVRPLRGLSVLDNVVVGCMFGRPRADDSASPKKGAERILEFVGLDDESGKLAGALTFAQCRRLEIARALASNPKVLLLDEVFAGLNPSELANTCDLIRRINQDLAVTVIIIEHLLKAISTLAGKVVVLHHGEKIAEGSPKEVFKSSNVVQAYLGPGEFLDA